MKTDVLFKESGKNIKVIFQSKKAKDFYYKEIPKENFEKVGNSPSLLIAGGVENLNKFIALLVSHNLSSTK
jgi:hypothetical protein